MNYEEKIKHDFETKKYAHLEGLLDLDNCKQLTDEIKKLVEQNKSTKDAQCPISESIAGHPVLDSLLEQLTPHFELATGKKLFPTYAYARLYKPGEVLKPHIDRPSCEISATLTLSFNGDIWPIFMADYVNDEPAGETTNITDEEGIFRKVKNVARIDMNVGDAVLYRGCEKAHWREKYKEGEWQTQVFLHYVDANGPFAEFKYDKRPRLSHHSTPDYSVWIFTNSFTKDACNKIIQSLESQHEGEVAGIGIGTEGIINKTVRDVKRICLPIHKGIGATMAGMGLSANAQAWKFDITHANQCDYLMYDKDGHYKAHVDTFINPGDPQTRKLTVLAFLNDDFEGGKLFIQEGETKKYPPQEAGTVIVFPSYLTHGVEPVTKGIRRSVVTWMVGPWFK